jgi:plasmid stability protein
MANLTITVDEEVLERARIRALQQGTSVDALLRDYLERLAGNPLAQRAVEEIQVIANRVHAGSGASGRTWKRDDAHGR